MGVATGPNPSNPTILTSGRTLVPPRLDRLWYNLIRFVTRATARITALASSVRFQMRSVAKFGDELGVVDFAKPDKFLFVLSFVVREL